MYQLGLSGIEATRNDRASLAREDVHRGTRGRRLQALDQQRLRRIATHRTTTRRSCPNAAPSTRCEHCWGTGVSVGFFRDGVDQRVRRSLPASVCHKSQRAQAVGGGKDDAPGRTSKVADFERRDVVYWGWLVLRRWVKFRLSKPLNHSPKLGPKLGSWHQIGPQKQPLAVQPVSLAPVRHVSDILFPLVFHSENTTPPFRTAFTSTPPLPPIEARAAQIPRFVELSLARTSPSPRNVGSGDRCLCSAGMSKAFIVEYAKTDRSSCKNVKCKGMRFTVVCHCEILTNVGKIAAGELRIGKVLRQRSTLSYRSRSVPLPTVTAI